MIRCALLPAGSWRGVFEYLSAGGVQSNVYKYMSGVNILIYPLSISLSPLLSGGIQNKQLGQRESRQAQGTQVYLYKPPIPFHILAIP